MSDQFYIDDDAKVKIPLLKLEDKFTPGEFYYVGKLQFPGTMDFQHGVSFMVFASESNAEELHIGHMKHSISKSSSMINQSGLTILLTKKEDSFGQNFYIGDIRGIVTMPLNNGIFFKAFLRDDKEELIISPLKNNKYQKKRFGSDTYRAVNE